MLFSKNKYTEMPEINVNTLLWRNVFILGL